MLRESQKMYLQPRFSLESDRSIDDICDDFRCRFSKTDSTYSGTVTYGYVSIYPSAKERHYWSPYFSLSMEVNEEGQNLTKVSGIYGPAPEVWTLFIFFYGIIGLALLIVLVVGFANLSIGESGQILWLVPIFLMALSSMYLVSYYGQRKGRLDVEGIYAMINKVIVSKKLISDC